jgi:hypothetical protein
MALRFGVYAPRRKPGPYHARARYRNAAPVNYPLCAAPFRRAACFIPDQKRKTLKERIHMMLIVCFLRSVVKRERVVFFTAPFSGNFHIFTLFHSCRNLRSTV